ncbi:plasmid fertility inhibition factor family protein [Paraburkholderia sp. RL18-085-BIA-A]|uniref:plasmid fertility inhibition factor family protein n=1 Tax=Paraburkholderia sp. RL18-085-BIA-A TaxID=3031633 RepID=UPI0038B8B58B
MLLSQSARSVSALFMRWRLFVSLASLPLPLSNSSSAAGPASPQEGLPSGRAETVWMVPLHDHPWYDHVRLKRVFVTDGTRHQVVLVDVRKLLACANRDNTDYVLKPVPEWHSGKVRGIREFLDPDSPRIPQMPYVTISTRRASGLLGWLGLEREGVVAFRNGQHRARYLAEAGARWCPVEVHEREAALLREICGAADDARTVVRAVPLGREGDA